MLTWLLAQYLESKEFKMLIVKLVDQLDVGSIAKPNRNMWDGVSHNDFRLMNCL